MEMLVCESFDKLSTFAEHWTRGRFAGKDWNKKIPVVVTTLDRMIEEYGMPQYCKIDVEGFEYSVLRGLTKAVPYISFEFTYEFVDNAQLCLAHLKNLGYRKFNLAIGESDSFAFSEWVSSDQVMKFIRNSADQTLWGEIYAFSGERATVSAAPKTTLDDLKTAGLWREGQPLKLHLGCGETLLEGYINIDYPISEHAVMKVKPDFNADITAMNFPVGSVDEIRLHHVFEHFSRVTALAQLIKWQQWLKVGGSIHIETPDLVGCAKILLDPAQNWATRMGIVRHLAGDQTAGWAYHIDQWFPERYQKTLARLGFGEVSTETWNWEKPPYLANVVAKAKKSRTYSLSELISIGDELLLESLVDPCETWNQEVWTRQLRAMLNVEQGNASAAIMPENVRDSRPGNIHPKG
jgi:hypothetical protein